MEAAAEFYLKLPASLLPHSAFSWEFPVSQLSLLPSSLHFYPSAPSNLTISEHWMDLAETKAACKQNSCTHMIYHCSQTSVGTLLTSGPGPPASTGRPSAGSSAESACPDEDLCSVTKEERFFKYLPIFPSCSLAC